MGAGVCRSLGEKHQGYAGKQEARWPVIFVGEGIVNGHWLLSRKVKYLSHLAKHEGGGIAIVLAIVGAKQAPCFGRRQIPCWQPQSFGRQRRNARGGTVELLKEFPASRRHGAWRGAQRCGAESWRGRSHGINLISPNRSRMRARWKLARAARGGAEPCRFQSGELSTVSRLASALPFA